MTTHKTFKRRVRARMTRTGEQYSAARRQLLEKADRRAAEDASATTGATPGATPSGTPGSPDVELLMSDDALRRGTGRAWGDWFGLLDAWGATQRRHPEIARWLGEEHGVGPWWRQTVTVGYERARGMRAVHETPAGFEIGVSRTVNVPVERLSAAFTDRSVRDRWLPGAPLQQRPTRAGSSVRFDWTEDGSVVALTFLARGDRKSHVALRHEKLPDAEATVRMKAYWRERLGALKQMLET